MAWYNSNSMRIIVIAFTLVLTATARGADKKSCSSTLDGHASIDFSRINTTEDFDRLLSDKILIIDAPAVDRQKIESDLLGLFKEEHLKFADGQSRALFPAVIIIPDKGGYLVDFQNGYSVFIPRE